MIEFCCLAINPIIMLLGRKLGANMIARVHTNLIFLFTIALLIGGCNTTSRMLIPIVKETELLSINKPKSDQATFALTKVIANLKRGTTIVHFPSAGVEGVNSYLCNYTYEGDSTLEWGAGTKVLGNWRTELGEIFYEALTQKGLHIAGDPKDMFGRRESIASTEYLIGARISKISGNFCEEHHWWDGRPLGKYAGEMYIKVEWTIFSSLLQREVVKVNTEGYFKQKRSKKDGISRTFREAFAQASENLMSSKELIKIATREKSPVDKASTGQKLVFKGGKERKSTVKNDLDRILPSVVTIRLGLGHGSGFFISENGLILSNSHVVQEAKKVSVILNNGLEVAGQVVRVNKQRDVALIKVALRIRNFLPIRITKARPLDTVYVIGTPIKERLRSTITAGIVSAIRKDERTGLEFIQSDAAISPGNSGGPLLDKNGNVIGISVAKITGGASESLNMFIPIGSALNALNLQHKSPDN
jgi:serine protease Do